MQDEEAGEEVEASVETALVGPSRLQLPRRCRLLVVKVWLFHSCPHTGLRNSPRTPTPAAKHLL